MNDQAAVIIAVLAFAIILAAYFMKSKDSKISQEMMTTVFGKSFERLPHADLRSVTLTSAPPAGHAAFQRTRVLGGMFY